MIVLKVEAVKNLKEKAFGLIRKKYAKPLLIKTRFGIHTFFLKFPIDVIVLNKNDEVKHMKENMKPNRLFIWNPIYVNVIELPQGSIGRMKIKIGDRLEIKIS